MTVLEELFRRQPLCRGPGQDLARGAYTAYATYRTDRQKGIPRVSLFSHFYVLWLFEDVLAHTACTSSRFLQIVHLDFFDFLYNSCF